MTTAIPKVDLKGRAVLDVGCNDGKIFEHPAFDGCATRTGIDPFLPAAVIANERYALTKVSAEAMNFPHDSFDVVMSRVAIPYTHIPTAIKEMHRVLKPGGHLFITLHDWRELKRKLKVIPKDRQIKPVINLAYMMFASALFSLTGKLPKRPWADTYESFQSVRRMRKLLKAAGFDEIMHGDTDEHFIMTAWKR